MKIRKINLMLIDTLKKENTLLKQELQLKQQQINKVNAYYKRKLSKR